MTQREYNREPQDVHERLKREPELPDQYETDQAAQISCPNCGAGFSPDEPRCPYCGELNPSGAEKAYMRTLDGIKEDTEDLADDVEEDFASDLRHNTGRTIAIALAVVAVLACVFMLVNCMDQREERQSLEAYQAREAFRAQYFEEFDRLYEAGDDDALSAYVWNLMDDPGFDAYYSWRHIGVLEAHDDCEALHAAAEQFAAKASALDDYTWSVAVALRLSQLDETDRPEYAKLSAEEEARVTEYRAYAWQFLRDTLQMNDDELTAFADGLKDEQGFVQEDKLKHELELRLKQLGALR
jgi:hypothetical protein